MGAGGKSEIDRDAAKKILKILEDNYNSLSEGEGSPQDVSDNGNVTSTELGGSTGHFATAIQLGANTSRAYSVINSQYQAFVNSYGQVIEALRRAVQNHDDKEEANTTAARSVQVPHSGAPTTGTTRAY